ncbi:MAG: ATP-binding protein [Chloroflexota bacterium]|nr:ATP-binding protein [Chloroflexota bacterium]
MLGLGIAAWIPLIAFFCYGGLFLIILRKGPPKWEARVFVSYLVVMIVWSIASFLVHADLGIFGILLWGKVLIGASTVMPITFYHFVRVFLGIREHKWLLHLGYVLWGATLVVLFTTGYVLEEAHTVQGLYHVETGPAMSFIAAYDAFFLLLAMFYLLRRYREAKDPSHRNRVGYLVIGTSLVLMGGLSNSIPNVRMYPVDIVANIINAILIVYTILRYQLLDIILVVRKGLLYSIPTAIIGGIYFFTIYLAVNLFHIVTGYQIFFLSLVVAIIMALAFQPLRDRVQFWVDRLFFREKYDAGLMLQRLSHTVASVLDLDELTSMILDEVTTTMHIERAAFFLRQEKSDEFRLIAQKGLDPNADFRLRKDHPVVRWLSRNEHALTRHDMGVMPQFRALWEQEIKDSERIGAEIFIPLQARGGLVGILAVGPKLSEETYSQDDQLTLTTLANQTAVAVENARLYDAERQRSAELDAFAHTVAHDLQNPLGLVIGFAETLEKDYTAMPGEETRHYLHTIARNARKASSIINELFLLAEVSKVEVQASPLDMASIVAEAQQQLAHIIEEYQAEIVVPEAWPVALGYGPWVEGVWVNYLSNAIKYGGRPPHVELGAAIQADGTVRFWVRDNGPGLTPKEQSPLFMPFTRLDWSRSGGHGLGLSIVRRVVEKLDGQVGVESKIGRGSVFSFTLPGVVTLDE